MMIQKKMQVAAETMLAMVRGVLVDAIGVAVSDAVAAAVAVAVAIEARVAAMVGQFVEVGVVETVLLLKGG